MTLIAGWYFSSLGSLNWGIGKLLAGIFLIRRLRRGSLRLTSKTKLETFTLSLLDFTPCLHRCKCRTEEPLLNNGRADNCILFPFNRLARPS